MRLGIDLGGSKIAGVVLDDHGRTLAERRVPTPAGDYRGTVAAVAGLVCDLESAVGASRLRVGVGMPGAVDPRSGKIKNANSACLNGRDLQQDLETALRRPVRLANDADCLAVSEATDGAGGGAFSVFAVILGTGVGGGWMVAGSLLAGPNAICGEWGHNPLPWAGIDETPGPACWCKKQGCLETWLSGPALVADCRKLGGAAVDAIEVAQRAAAGEAAANAALAAYERRLARALAVVINLLDPDVIVLGGGLSRLGRLYDNVPACWQQWVFSAPVNTPLLPAAHGDASGVRGAAWLWEEGDT